MFAVSERLLISFVVNSFSTDRLGGLSQVGHSKWNGPGSLGTSRHPVLPSKIKGSKRLKLAIRAQDVADVRDGLWCESRVGNGVSNSVAQCRRQRPEDAVVAGMARSAWPRPEAWIIWVSMPSLR